MHVISISVAIDNDDSDGDRLLISSHELEHSDRLLLSIVGHVFDVSAGSRFYGSNKPYGSFVGRDATRAFATGDFEKDLRQEIDGLHEDECSSILYWLGFYKKSNKYPFIGYLQESIYFDFSDEGRVKSEHFTNLMRCANALKEQEEDKHEKCVSTYDFRQKIHTKRCVNGVPRRALITKPHEHFKEKCICVPSDEVDTRRDVHHFDGCEPMAKQCKYGGNLEGEL